MTTVGAAALSLLEKGDQKQPVVDTQQEMMKGYVDQLITAAQRGTDLFGTEKPFYVCVQTRRERLLENVIRNQFYPRQTRPRPEYDLALYWYDPKAEELRFVWCIPDKDTVESMCASVDVPKEEKDLRAFCLAFKQGCLV